MKSLIYKNKNTLKIIDKNNPIPILTNENQVLIKVLYGGICGSDLKILKGEHARAKPGIILGHEIIGEIVKMNKKSEFKIGDKVAINPIIQCNNCCYCKQKKYNLCNNIKVLGADTNGGFTEYLRTSIDKLHRIDSNNLKEMTLVEPLAVAINTINRSCITSDLNTLIFGGGTIGLLIGQLLLNRDCEVTLSEPYEYRAKIGSELGFIKLKNKSNQKFDLIYDTTGNPKVMSKAFNMIKKNGEINIVGINNEPSNIEFEKVVYSQIDIKGSFLYSAEDIEEAIKLIMDNKINVSPIITDVISINEYHKAFKIAKNKNKSIKVLLEI